ncbi:MAG: molybdenum cofactor guanylyltransferase [Planctomycetota bacterium]
MAAGLVLCGGESRRMGSPKAWLDWRGRPLLAHMIDLLGGAGLAPLAVCAAPGQSLPMLPTEVMLVRDAQPHAGPLHGLAAGLSALEPMATRALVCPCDSPILCIELARVLLARPASVVVGLCGGVVQPFPGAYDTDIGRLARELINRGQNRLMDLLEAAPAAMVEEAELRRVDPDLRSFLNCNDPESYARAKIAAAQSV